MCNKQYTNRGSLWQHKTSLWQLSSEDIKPQRMNELDIPVISVICQSSVLRQHKASVHEGDRYKCNTCDYKAAQKEYL